MEISFGDGFHVCGAATIEANRLSVSNVRRYAGFLFAVGSFTVDVESNLEADVGFRNRPDGMTSFEGVEGVAAMVPPIPEKALWSAPPSRY